MDDFQERSTPQTQTRRRRRRNPIPMILIVIVIICVAVALLSNRSEKNSDYGHSISGGDYKPSREQRHLEDLDWVDIDLLPINEYSRVGDKVDGVKDIVIHYVGNPGTTAEQNRSFFSNLATTGETYASSNFVIGMDGKIINCVPIDEIAYCSNTRNIDSLSIECCHPDAEGKFTDDTYESLVKLTAWLCNEFKLDYTNIIRHYDITGKECPKYFVDYEDEWESFKLDVKDAMEEQDDD